MSKAIVWFRQDLRLTDNPALYAAINAGHCIIPLFIWDDEQSDCRKLGGAQKWWLHHSLISLDTSLKEIGSRLILRKGLPSHVLQTLIKDDHIDAVYWNRCYEPDHIERDKDLKFNLKKNGIIAESFNSHLLFEPWTIQNNAGQPYKVFSHFWKNYRHRFDLIRPVLEKNNIMLNPDQWPYSDNMLDWHLLPTPLTWADDFAEYWQPGEKGAIHHLKNFLDENIEYYKEDRNFPHLNATSRLSPHLHFGEISSHMILEALQAHFLTGFTREAECYIKELGWREFDYALLYYFPHIIKHSFRPEFDRFQWENHAHHLACWQKGLTGYPIVDAGMRQLWKMGWMHNRVRMIVASFLTKDLLIDWREGEAWFWDTLVDADVANNTTNWQWVAGSGADAAPFFRIFNPILQGEKFDSEGDYIRQWVPELAKLSPEYIHKPWQAPPFILEQACIELGKTYPLPIVNHDAARHQALQRYSIMKTP